MAIVDPHQVLDFARATGRLAKADRPDAEVLAHFGEAVRPEARPLASEQTQALAALVYAAAPTGRDADGREESPERRPKGFTP